MLLTACAASVFGASGFAVHAKPLTKAAFDELASRCAPDVKVSTLSAVAKAESHFEPWALRDNNSHQTWNAKSLLVAEQLAGDRLRLGHSVDLGLMQINSKNLPLLGMGISDAFDACDSLRAGDHILHTALIAGSSETEREAALLIEFSRYNTGKSLAGIVNGYANEVISAHSELSVDEELSPSMQSTTWDIWRNAGVPPTSWVVTADGLSEIERAGAQTSDARNEGRAPASPSEKGEPYELFAYQESEPNRP